MSEINDLVLFRDYQIETLSSFLHADPKITPPNLVIQGYSSTGKTHTLQQFFAVNHFLINVWLEPIELVTWKPFMQAVARIIQNKLKSIFHNVKTPDYDPLDVEEPYLLVKFLNNLFENYQSLLQDPICIFLVCDGFDSLQDLDAALFHKFVSLHELISVDLKIQLRIIYTIQDMAFIERYSSLCLPLVVFPRYTMDQIIDILIFTRAQELIESQKLREKVLQGQIDECSDDEFLSVAINFIKLIVQAFHSYTGNNISTLNDLIDFKWESYVDKINRQNIFDPLGLYRSAIAIFLTTDDSLNADFPENSHQKSENEATQTYELSPISKYLLIAAYICSYLEPRYDSSVFSRKSHVKTGRVSYGRRKKMEINPRYLQPSIFSVERLLAVFQAIFPIDTKAQRGSLASLKEDSLMRANVEVFQNLAELHSLKLLATTVGKNIDFLNYKVKWKVNVPWEIVSEVSKSVNFDVGQYFTGEG